MHAAPTEIIYSRSVHGSIPIRVVTPGRPPAIPGVFETLAPGGDVVGRYGSARSLIAALTGNPRHTLSFDRYFGVPNLAPAGESILDLFKQVPIVEAPILCRPVARTRPPRRQTAVTIAITGQLGIDLERRGHEVRKILFAGFGSRMTRAGYDPEEVLQEVYRGILARNIGKCPFDAKKSSFGHYVHMICECILNNYHRRESRRREVEQVGMAVPGALRDEAEGSTGTIDAGMMAERVLIASWSSDRIDDTGDAIRQLQMHLRKRAQRGDVIHEHAPQVAALLVAGMGRREIAQQLRVSQGEVGHIVDSLREYAADWF